MDVFGQHVHSERQDSFSGDPWRNKNPPAAGRGVFSGWASEGLLGGVVVEGGGHVRPLLQLVVLQMKLLGGAAEVRGQ